MVGSMASDQATKAAKGAATSPGSGRLYTQVRASTSSDIENVYRHVDTVRSLMEAKVEGLRSEIKGELAIVAASVREAEAKRSEDYTRLSTAVEGVRSTLPTKDDIQRSTRNWAVALGGFTVGLASLLWMFFDTGTGITGAVADEIIKIKASEQQRASDLQEIKELLVDVQDEAPKKSPEGPEKTKNSE